MLYPIKFKPIFVERIWGGDSLKTKLNKRLPDAKKIGESWEISAVQDSLSVVNNGILKGNTIEELIEIFMGELVGEKVYEQFGIEFPLLIKFLDSQDILSIQVHPNDELAKERHNSFGKTEMWYIIHAEPGSESYVGFNRKVSQEEYLRASIDNNLPSLLNKVEFKTGDCYMIPTGTIHTLGKGVVVAEIQQTSDITYRLSDWGRVDANGEPRELHVDLAFDAIDFDDPQNYNLTKDSIVNTSVELAKCPYFTTNLLEIEGTVNKDYSTLDSFVVYLVLEGKLTLECEEFSLKATKGDCILIPALFEEVNLEGTAKLLEVYIG